MSERLLAVFDIDGTLTDSTAIDDRCYVEALREQFDLDPAPGSYDWHTYRHVSDTGVLIELLERVRGIPPTGAEIAAFESCFVSRVRSAIEEDGSLVRPIAGAPRLLDALAAETGWRVAFATGGFAASAALKLEAAGLRAPEVLVSSDRIPARADIVRTAIERATPTPVDGIVTVGDGTWDASTAAELCLPFVGVAAGEHAAALLALGAWAVVADFSDTAATVSLLREAALRGGAPSAC